VGLSALWELSLCERCSCSSGDQIDQLGLNALFGRRLFCLHFVCVVSVDST
jgi:hypothetical protein